MCSGGVLIKGLSHINWLLTMRSYSSFPLKLPQSQASQPFSWRKLHHLYPQSYFFDQYPKLMAIGEGRNIDLPVNQQLPLYGQFSLHHSALIHCLRWYAAFSPSSLFPTSNKFLRYLKSSTWGPDSSPIHPCPNDNRALVLQMLLLI